jgi:anti-anti-sigma factor
MDAPHFRHLRCRVEGDVLVVVLAPAHIQGDELAEALRDELHTAVRHFGKKQLVLDFQVVNYLGSAGFRPLLSIYRKLQTLGGRMILCNLSFEVGEVLVITRLISTSGSLTAPFEQAADVAEALRKLGCGDQESV